ncbi:oxidoreductase [Blastopirellula marina]|uniref:Oxidoreductase n=1 Tax=Blastopirellula marina TaxID=124 RepID=A0A2S8FMG6_9BACT|nr:MULTISPECIES: Gfo/Idh/MocA family oxidoreductase [Pirellulaceae]PQO33392.1 oxidoreductase [Blastopirellula marina]RCS52481.1 gfo/Idh/MocA family oxidoreductase [Bremerella cremea]
MTRIALLGTGLIGRFYAQSLHGKRSRDRIQVVYSRSPDRAAAFADEFGISQHTTSWQEAIASDQIDAVVIGLPNHLHLEVVLAAAAAGKAILCTKPLGINAEEALQMLNAVEEAGVYHAYLEDLVYTPKTLKALQSVQAGAIGDVLWVRSREAHPGPHSDWFWNKQLSGGGAIIDLGCHCIEIARNFIGKEIRPVEVMCWAETQFHPVDVEDHAIGLVRYENGAIGQFETSWIFRGGMDLRDEVGGTEGTIWLNHWLRTGMEMFSSSNQSGYIAEKAETDTGWLFPVGNEGAALGYDDMFADVLTQMESGGKPQEDFYDGYVVNAIIDAAYQSVQTRQWSPVELPLWRGHTGEQKAEKHRAFDEDHDLIKSERMPDGATKYILRNKQTGELSQRIVAK